MSGKFRILFICTHNSARSIMAEALALNLAPELIESYSAGTNPTKVRTNTKIVLEELGFETKNMYHLENTSKRS